MGYYRQNIKKEKGNGDYLHENRAICLHAFSDLSHICPATFVYLLKECYVCGKFYLLECICCIYSLD